MILSDIEERGIVVVGAASTVEVDQRSGQRDPGHFTPSKITLKGSDQAVDDPELRYPDRIASISEHDVGHLWRRPTRQDLESVIVTPATVEQVPSALPR